MTRCILVPATGTSVDTPVFQTALAVARPFGAHLDVLHLRPDIRQTVALMATGDVGGGWGLDDVAADMERIATGRAQAAAEAFQQFCARAQIQSAEAPTPGAPTLGTGVSASMRTETADEASGLAEQARFADLIVLGRAREEHDIAWEVLESVLVGSGRPMLVAPANPPESLSGPVAIAWKNTPEAARAVAAATPFIARAPGVVILAVEEGDGDSSPDRLQRALRWHNPDVTVERLRAEGSLPPGEMLLEAAQRRGASLLAMGGYGHTRLREWVFGGVTARILRGADLPVLMAH